MRKKGGEEKKEKRGLVEMNIIGEGKREGRG